MKFKQHVLSIGLGCLSVLSLACTHETAVGGATDTQLPKAEAVPPTASHSAEAPAAPSGNEGGAVGCSSDSDCRAVDVYCGGCQCMALAASAPAPTCPGSEVQCFAQPCRGQRAVCKAGACSLGGGSTEQ
jgi:hypothetical protein